MLTFWGAVMLVTGTRHFHRCCVIHNFTCKFGNRARGLSNLCIARRFLNVGTYQIRSVNTTMAASSSAGSGTGTGTQFGCTTYKKQPFDYFLVLDFEATCDNKEPPEPQEIIEFPVLKINATTFQVEDTFHQYVQPEIHPQLTPFCTELTGIIQDMVDGQPNLATTMKSFDQWMLNQGLLQPDIQSVFVTCGNWDLNTMLPGQCKYFGLHRPDYFNRWVNIKKAFSNLTGQWPKGMMGMLTALNLQHQGRHHSGIDDCKNIANILRAMAEKGHVFKVTGYL